MRNRLILDWDSTQNPGCFLGALVSLIHPHPLVAASATLQTSVSKQKTTNWTFRVYKRERMVKMGSYLLSTLHCSVSLCLFTRSETQRPLSNLQLGSKGPFSFCVMGCHSCAVVLGSTKGNTHPPPITTPCLLESREDSQWTSERIVGCRTEHPS